MTARSIWQGTLTIKQQKLPVKLYSAVQDQHVHFHLLHRRDRTRVQQRMIDTETDQAVPFGDAQKAFEADAGRLVMITPEDIEKSVPKPDRNVTLHRFIPRSAIDPRFYDRPYYLGPGAESATDYFALAQALEQKKRAGIASWVMRKHSYVGGLFAEQGYLMLITLRHADEVIPLDQLPAPTGGGFGAREIALAEKLIEALSGEFAPEAYHDEYQGRIRELIAAKRHGKKLRGKRAPRRKPAGSLADSLEASLRGIRGARPA